MRLGFSPIPTWMGKDDSHTVVSVLTELVNSPDIAFIRSTMVKEKEKRIAILLWEFWLTILVENMYISEPGNWLVLMSEFLLIAKKKSEVS